MFRFNYSLRLKTVLILAGTALSLNFSSPASVADETIDPEAKRIVSSMSNYLRRLDSFTVEADIDFESVNQNGQKIQLTSLAKYIVNRPNRFYLKRQGLFANVESFFDGKIVTLYGRFANAYFQFKSPGSIDNALSNLSRDLNLDLPGAEIVYSKSDRPLLEEVESGSYYGKTYVNGIECHHLGFRKQEVDLQIWVKTGNSPLPMKYIITSKWTTSGPQYSIRFRNWDNNPLINPTQFKFIPPSGAVRLKTINFNELGEPELEGSNQNEN